MPRITKKLVDSLEPDPSRKGLVWDDRLPGFGVTVHPTGAKVYFYNYRTPEGRQRRIKIDRHGAVSPDEARRIAEGYAHAVREGRDPQAEKTDKRNTPTVNDVLDEYLASERFRRKAETTQAVDRGRIDRHLRPTVGRLYADRLTPEDVAKAQRAIAEGRTAAREKTKARGLARVTGGPGTARKAIRLLGAVLRWAQAERPNVKNPVPHVDVGGDGQRNTILESPEQYTRLFETLARMEDERRIRGPVAAAIMVLALTGARRSEITRLRWRHVNMKDREIRIPAGEHKTGRATGKERVIGLPAVAAAIIADQAGGTEPAPDVLVFTPARGTEPLSLAKPWRTVREEAELPEGIGLHGLRHSLASWMAMRGAEASSLMHALGHSRLSTTSRYLHLAKSAHAALAEDAARTVTDAFRAAKGEPSATVTDISTGTPAKRDMN